MAEDCSTSQEQWADYSALSASENKSLVILSSSLAESELHRLLTIQQLRIKGCPKHKIKVVL